MLHLLYVLEQIRQTPGAIQLPPEAPTEAPPWANPENLDETLRPRTFRFNINPRKPQDPEPPKKLGLPVKGPESEAKLEYAPLHAGPDGIEVRLLRLLPGRGTEPIRCELVRVPVESATGKYEALSYCWGPSTPRVTLFCNGTAVSVTANLGDALRARRSPESTRILWVDALCINQTDNDEKRIQVPLMNRIYRGASTVRVWVGNDTPSQPITQALNILRNVYRLCVRFGWDLNFPYIMLNRSLLKESGFPDMDDKAWRSIKYLVEMPWFSRTWIIQEVVLSRGAYLHSDNTTLRWVEFCIGFVALSRQFLVSRPDCLPTLPAFVRVMELMLSYHTTGRISKGLDFLALLENHRTALATDPRDKVYGFLGIYEELAGTQGPGIVPDYVNMTARDLYLTTTVRIVQHTNVLDVLGIAGLGQRGGGLSDLPSWATDWSISDVANGLNRRAIDGTYLYDFHACGDTLATSCHPTFENEKLRLNGVYFDEISTVGDVNDLPLRKDGASLSISSTPFQVVALFLSWLRTSGSLDPKQRYPDGNDMLSSFIHTLFLDKIPEDLPDEIHLNRDPELPHLCFPLSFNSNQRQSQNHKIPTLLRFGYFTFGLFIRFARPGPFYLAARAARRIEDSIPLKFRAIMRYAGPRGKQRLENRPWNSRDYHMLFMNLRSLSKRLLVTKGGYIGLGPREMQVGDRVFLVRGSRTPLVLRPRGDQWELVGDCFVRGIMQGEAFDEAKCEQLEVV
ncbi:heterokaryon incompatibility protein-domain-containing protein [Immersiella caudata]|uniref:Heterokaryon incompatibility protein-domain-containing protein n=1 Tax=Immersiella caudata TaxID=314043 RepID=A0AA40BWI7_9PEZI|nr:heterokaryon incompatibility protein-domain-containing protein [Immersiella caudata]